jgi:hypothetical protein
MKKNIPSSSPPSNALYVSSDVLVLFIISIEVMRARFKNELFEYIRSNFLLSIVFGIYINHINDQSYFLIKDPERK